MTTVNVHPAGGDPLASNSQSSNPAPAWQPPMASPAPQQQPAPIQGATASQAILSRQQKSARATDAYGRVIGFVRPAADFRMRMMRVAGGELTRNEIYFGHFMLAACIREMDGETIPEPTSVMQVEALVSRLGDVGLDAVAEGMSKLTGDNQKAEAEVVAAAKN